MVGLTLYLDLIDSDEDKQKFELLYKTYRYRMLYICHDILRDRYLAEDALQEAFLSIIRRMDKIGDVESKNTACYIYLIAKSRAIDMYRKVNRDHQRIFPIEDYGLVTADMDLALLEDEESREIAMAIGSLKPLSRQILELYLEKQMSRKEISILLNLKYDTVRKRINTALAELKTELHEKGIYG